MRNVSQLFGSKVFNQKIMKERLPKQTYKEVMSAINDNKRLDVNVANVVANAMKDWAVENGVTHYTHWFQPMTGITAEKHDSFISPMDDGTVIMEFSGKELVHGEPDASSFPNGGLRATFEARGYTAWDPTAYAFIKDEVLCIPTAFCSYGGEALDKKTPLLRSMEALNKQAMRILRLFGDTETKSVKTTVGPEQEYFLIDEKVYKERRDLIYTGRTLFGAKSPKGQELDDHYFGSLKPRVSEFMRDLDEELWKLGIMAKTKHNEVAPGQHELAPIFTTTNIATDHNQLTMELMKKIAQKHGMVCLLHEKPFAGVNGSGKHNNWSLSTNRGVNLLEPGETPNDNAQFILFLCSVIKAVDEHQDIIRLSVASAGNDHRLGANEAPPAIVSMFVGSDLEEILECIDVEKVYDAKKKVHIQIGVNVLPQFPRDNTDRNRTSPFAFTGNKFEFRAPGSAMSIAGVNFVLNTAVTESLKQFADELEKSEDFNKDLASLIKRTIHKHKRIIFNGNGYDDAWVKEATQVRGLLNLQTTPDACSTFLNEKNVKLFSDFGVLTFAEMKSRHDITLDNYIKTVSIEVLTMLSMAKQDYLPAITKYIQNISITTGSVLSVCPQAECSYEKETITKLSSLCSQGNNAVKELENIVHEMNKVEDLTKKAFFVKEKVIPSMNELRIYIDQAEMLTDREFWPVPDYGDLLFSVK